MLKHPPDILITTPESLYLLLTAERSRAMLRSVRHRDRGRDPRGRRKQARLAPDPHPGTAGARRGQPVQRVGLSATQRPIEADRPAAGRRGPDRDNADGTPRCAIVDSGHRRRLDLALELPDDELGAVPTGSRRRRSWT
jgi:Lhr-like helicases